MSYLFGHRTSLAAFDSLFDSLKKNRFIRVIRQAMDSVETSSIAICNILQNF